MTARSDGVSRRDLIRVAGLAGVATAAAGCGEGWGGQASGTKGKVNITYALWDAYQQVGYQKSIDDFQRRNPDIAVTIEQIPYSSYQPKITAGYISGNAPDLFWVNTPFLADWIASGILSDVTDRVTADKVDLEQYYPALVRLHERDGRLYGLPKDWDTIGLYYNRDFVAKHRVKIPDTLTWTPDGGGNFGQFLQQLTVDRVGRHPGDAGFRPDQIATYGIGVSNDPQSGYGNFLAMNGGGLIPEPYATESSLDTEGNKAAMRYVLQTLDDAHVMVPAAEMGPNGNGANALQLFAQGRVATYMAGDWNTNSLAQTATFKVGVLPLPEGPQGSVCVFNGLTDGMNSATEHPEEAWRLARWLASAESQKILGEGGYVWPAIESLDPLFLRYWKGKDIDMSAFLTAARGKVSNWPVTYGIAEAITDIGTALGPAFLGSGSIDAGLAAAQKVADYRIQAATKTAS